ncbi:MAG TPA: hypothetical protein VGR18_03120 [Rubrobacter sp.]|nr:hypothetical protein [Rubrobacter sp.]
MRYAAYVAIAIVAFLAAAGVGAAASLVVGWQSERVSTGPGGPTGSGTPEGAGSETTGDARISEGTAVETTNDAEDPGAQGDAFVHRATDANSRGDYTYLDHPSINGEPDAVVLAKPSPGQGGDGGAPYDHNIGVWYEPTKERWAVFNQDLTAVPAGSAFEIFVPPADEGFVHRATQENTVGNATYIDNPLLDGEPDAGVSVTLNWNPGGGNGVYNDHPVGALYDGDVEKWFVYNEDDARVPEGAAFNVAVSGAEPAR